LKPSRTARSQFAVVKTREVNRSPASSSIARIASDEPDSLTFSTSFSRSAGEVECILFNRTGQRCSADVAKCDCNAYDEDDENREFWRSLRLRKEMEAHMLDVGDVSKRIGTLDDVTEPKVITEVRKRWIDKQDAQRILGDNKIDSFQTKVDDDQIDTFQTVVTTTTT
jgi:hypothetical protein